jgi:hypothetical protein
MVKGISEMTKSPSRIELMNCLEEEIKKNTRNTYCPLTAQFETALKNLIVGSGHKPTTRNFVILAMIDETLDRSPIKAQAVFNCVKADIVAAREVNGSKKREKGLDKLENALTCFGQHMKTYKPEQ